MGIISDSIGKAASWTGDKLSRAGETAANWVKDDIRDFRQASNTFSVASNLSRLVGKEKEYHDAWQTAFKAVGLGDTQPDYNASVKDKAISTGNALLTVLPIPVAGAGAKAVAKGAAKLGKVAKESVNAGKEFVKFVDTGKDVLKAGANLKNWKLTPRPKEVLKTKAGEIIYKPRLTGQPKIPRLKSTSWKQKPRNRELSDAFTRFDNQLGRVNEAFNRVHRAKKGPSVREGLRDVRKGGRRLSYAPAEQAVDYETEDRNTKKKKKNKR